MLFKRVIICNKNDVDYVTIRKSMAQGAKTIEDLVTIAGICNDCDCTEKSKEILSMVCVCKKVSREEIIKSVENGAKRIEDVMKDTNAGTGCGRCKPIIASFID